MTFLTPLLIVQAALDVVLILILGYITFFKHRRTERLLQSHQETMQRLINDSDASAQAFKKSLAEDLHRIRELIALQEQKGREFRDFLRESEELVRRKERERFLFADGHSADHYKRAAELVSRGLSKEEIEKETGMSPQEIQLILDIRK
jgi:hypothetical protein